jgi:hypothetical protein
MLTAVQGRWLYAEDCSFRWVSSMAGDVSKSREAPTPLPTTDLRYSTHGRGTGRDSTVRATLVSEGVALHPLTWGWRDVPVSP